MNGEALKRFGVQVLAVTVGVLLGMWLFAFSATLVAGELLKDAFADDSVSTPTSIPTERSEWDRQQCADGYISSC